MLGTEFWTEVDDIAREVNVYFDRLEGFRERVGLCVDVAAPTHAVRVRGVVPPVDVFAVGVEDGSRDADADRCVEAECFVSGFFIGV